MKTLTRSRLRLGALVTAGVLALATVPSLPASAEEPSPEPGFSTITNDTFWKDTDGNPIFSQGGGIFDFEDPETGELTHYWYGPRYTASTDYYNNPTQPILTGGDVFVAVSAYSSTDLVNWTYEGDVLTREQVDSFTDIGTGIATWVGRMGVVYVEELDTYALFSQHGIRVTGETKSHSREFIALSDSPTGPFVADRRVNMIDYAGSEMTTGTGDQTIFTDDDGKSYLLYSRADGRNKIWISEIGAVDGKVDFVRTQKIYDGYGREGNSMFAYDGKYYVTASDLFGWNASRPYYLVADDVFGPYTPANNMAKIPGGEADFGHVTQTGFYYKVKGTEQDTVIYAGDRWANFAGNGLGYNQWLPMSFNDDGTPYLNSLSQWNLDASTGEWAVGAKNNYVLNGAIEADRTPAPYTDKEGKPIPEIAGWTRTNPSAVWNEADKSGRVGNFNLTFYATTPFSAKIEQTIDPVNFPLPDGDYILSAQVRKAAAFKQASLYATSGGQTYATDIAAIPVTGADWVEVSVPVEVSGGSVTVGVSASGNTYQLLRVDDISLVAADLPDVDKSELGLALAEADALSSSDYTSASWAALRTTVSAAAAVEADSAATQESIDEAVANVRTAVGELSSAVVAISATSTKVYAVGEAFSSDQTTVTATRADGTVSLLTADEFAVKQFDTSAAGSATAMLEVADELIASNADAVMTTVTVRVLAGWSSSATYTAGNAVLHGGSEWVASWWTQGQAPGDPYGPWQEHKSAADGSTIWTASRIFTGGETVQHSGVAYTAKWWTRNQAPGDPNGPWARR